MSHRKILVVDDDKRLRDLLQRYLSEQGFTVKAAENAEMMDKVLARDTFDLIVLDLMLPGEDGLSICRRLRAVSKVPIIMSLKNSLASCPMRWSRVIRLMSVYCLEVDSL